MESNVNDEAILTPPLSDEVIVEKEEKQVPSCPMKHLYAVTCKCGHVGRNKFIPITFAVKAENGRAASAMVRRFPRVKHDRKYAIISCQKIDEAKAKIINKKNEDDPYLHCSSIQEQNLHPEIMERLLEEETLSSTKKKEEKALSASYLNYKKNRRKTIWQDYSEDFLD